MKVFRTTSAEAEQVTLQAKLQKLVTTICCCLPYGIQASSQHHHITPPS